MKKKHSDITTHLKNIYVQKVKRWTICPACQCGKMSFNKSVEAWECRNCGHQFLSKDFAKNQVYWFCEECNCYLNQQTGFDYNESKHICQNCGYENDISLDTVKGICVDCGAILSDADRTLCSACKRARKQKAKEHLLAAGKVVGAAAALVAGAPCIISAVKEEVDSNTYPIDSVEDDSDQILESDEEIIENFEEDCVEEDDSERLSADDAALIWAANGMDEDYMFGYSEDELRGNFR